MPRGIRGRLYSVGRARDIASLSTHFTSRSVDRVSNMGPYALLACSILFLSANAAPTLKRRAPLWAGVPLWSDVGTAENNSRAVQAPFAALAFVAPNWISTRIIEDPADGGAHESVLVTVYNYADYKAVVAPATWQTTSSGTGDYRNLHWWPGAYDQALAAAGVDIHADLYEGTVLSALTGKPSQSFYHSGAGAHCTDKECLFDILGQVQDRSTPMTIKTYDNATKLLPGRIFAVFGYKVEDDRPFLNLYDPFRAVDFAWSFDVAFDDIEREVHLEGSPFLA